MQSKTELGQIIHAESFDHDLEKDKIFSELQTATEKGAVSHVLAQMPKRGETITIRGLDFIVRSVGGKGSLHLRLKKSGK